MRTLILSNGKLEILKIVIEQKSKKNNNSNCPLAKTMTTTTTTTTKMMMMMTIMEIGSLKLNGNRKVKKSKIYNENGSKQKKGRKNLLEKEMIAC